MILTALLLTLAQPSSPPASPPTTDSSRIEKLPTPEEEVPVGSRLARRGERVTTDEVTAAWTMHRFAECLVRTRERQMVDFISTRLNSPEENRIVREVIGWRSRCLQARSMQIDHTLLRGAVAEALYRQELRGRDIPTVARAPEMLDADPARNSSAALERFARCMMMRHPQVVRPIIGTRPGSRQEREALTPILAVLPDCLPAPSPRARHPLRIRGALAEAFYLHRHGLIPGGQAVTATTESTTVQSQRSATSNE